MVLQIDGWKFDIDMAATMEYSANEAEDHCNCAYCRNFYAAIDDRFPEMRRFFAQFGLNIEAPDELMPFDMENGMVYLGEYAVAGQILEKGSSPMFVDGISVTAKEESDINYSIIGPSFFLCFDWFELPWVLNEPMRDVESASNFPPFLKRMWDKLLRRQPKNNITS